MGNMYEHMLRYFKTADHVWVPFYSANAIFQGCGMSVVLQNGYDDVWARKMESLDLQLSARAMADNFDIQSDAPDKLQEGIYKTLQFVELSGQSIAHEESFCYCTGGQQIRITLGDKVIKQVNDFRP